MRRRSRGSGSAGTRPSSASAPVGAPLPDAAHGGGFASRPAPAALIALASRSHGDSETEVLSRGAADRRAALARLVAQILHDRRRAGATSIRASARRWNGTRRRATPSCARPAASCSIPPDGRSAYGKIDSGLRNGAFVAWGDADGRRADSAFVNAPSTQRPKLRDPRWRAAIGAARAGR